MSIASVEIPIPAQYLPSGDQALLIAWVSRPEVYAVLVLEDGFVVEAALGEFKIDYRYDNRSQRFVDVSRVDDGDDEPEGSEGEDADANQEPADDGGEGVPGRVPETIGAGEGSPSEPGD